MKRILLFMMMITGTAAHAQGPASSPGNSSGNYELWKTPVLKVYSAQEGPATFHAYVVNWHDTEVVVSDRLGTTNYKVGDMMDVMVLRHEMNHGAQAMHFLSFDVLAPPRANKVVAPKVSSSVRATPVQAKIPSYIDCHEDEVVLYPGQTKVSWAELQQPSNALTTLLDEIQANSSSRNVMVLVRPSSVKFYRMVRRLIGGRRIEVGYDVVDADFQVNWDEAKAEMSAIKPPPPGPTANQIPVFFECRGGEVFAIDKDGIEAQVATLLSTLPPGTQGGDIQEFLKAIQGKEIGTEYYKMKPEYLLTGVVALDPRADLHGESREQLAKPDSQFAAALSKVNTNTRYLDFLIRDDSFDTFRVARALAQQRGFRTGWELLGVDEPIKFGAFHSDLGYKQ